MIKKHQLVDFGLYNLREDPSQSFSGAEKVWDFFKDKKRIKKDE